MFEKFYKNKELFKKLLDFSKKTLKEMKDIQSGKVKKVINIHITLTGIDALFYEEVMNMTKEMLPKEVKQKDFFRLFNRRIVLSGLTNVANFLVNTINLTNKMFKNEKNDPFNFI